MSAFNKQYTLNYGVVVFKFSYYILLKRLDIVCVIYRHVSCV